MDGGGHRVDPVAVLDPCRQLGNHLAGPGAHHGRAHQAPPAIAHQLTEAGGATVRDRPVQGGQIGPGVGDAVAVALPRLVAREPDVGELGPRERDPRHHRVDAPAGAQQGIHGGDACVVGRDVRVCHLTRDVSDGEHVPGDGAQVIGHHRHALRVQRDPSGRVSSPRVYVRLKSALTVTARSE